MCALAAKRRRRRGRRRRAGARRARDGARHRRHLPRRAPSDRPPPGCGGPGGSAPAPRRLDSPRPVAAAGWVPPVPEPDVNMELLHWAQALHLARTAYREPLRLPAEVGGATARLYTAAHVYPRPRPGTAGRYGARPAGRERRPGRHVGERDAGARGFLAARAWQWATGRTRVAAPCLPGQACARARASWQAPSPQFTLEDVGVALSAWPKTVLQRAVRLLARDGAVRPFAANGASDPAAADTWECVLHASLLGQALLQVRYRHRPPPAPLVWLWPGRSPFCNPGSMFLRLACVVFACVLWRRCGSWRPGTPRAACRGGPCSGRSWRRAAPSRRFPCGVCWPASTRSCLMARRTRATTGASSRRNGRYLCALYKATGRRVVVWNFRVYFIEQG